MKYYYNHKVEKPPWENSVKEEYQPYAADTDCIPYVDAGAYVPLPGASAPDYECRYPEYCTDGVGRPGSFKDYLMTHYGNDYRRYLYEILSNGRLPVSRSGEYITAPGRIRVDSVDVVRIELYRKSGCEVYSDVILAAYFTFFSNSASGMITENVSQRFRIRTIHNLSPDCLSFNNVEFAVAYESEERQPGMPLDEYLVPYTGTELMDGECLALLYEYYPEALDKPIRVSGEELARRMNLKIKYCRLAGSNTIRGQMYFESRIIDILDKNNHVCRRRVPANTIVVDISSFINDDMELKKELYDDTVIHECFHASRHRLFYLGQRLYNEEIRCLSCSLPGLWAGREIDRGAALRKSRNPDTAAAGDAILSEKSPVDWIEWQADRAAPRLRMPKTTAETKINELYAELSEKHRYMSREKLTAYVVAELAAFFGVSRQSAKLRMIELGYEEAKGVLNYVNGSYVENYGFTHGSLEKGQTFSIDLSSAGLLCEADELFRKRIGSGRYQYIDGHFCLNDNRFICITEGKPGLTAYAKTHMDECCLVFTVQGGKAGYGYKEGTLQKEHVPVHPVFGYVDKQLSDMDFRSEAERLSKILYSLPPAPSGTLIRHMERKKLTLEGLVAKSGVSVSTIKRLRNSDSCRTSRNNIIAVCIGLQLEPILQKDYLRKCGIMFSSSPEDVMYELMMCTMYTQPLSEFNRKLKEYGLPPLSRCTDELSD